MRLSRREFVLAGIATVAVVIFIGQTFLWSMDSARKEAELGTMRVELQIARSRLESAEWSLAQLGHPVSRESD